MIPFAFFAEALELDKAKYYRNLAKEAHPHTYKDKGRRIVLEDVVPFRTLEEAADELEHNLFYKSGSFHALRTKLASLGYGLGESNSEYMKSYLENIAYKIVSGEDEEIKIDRKNPTKITRVLEAGKVKGDVTAKLCFDRYMNDDRRTAFQAAQKDKANGVKLRVVISSLYLDVAGMSTDKKWTSCMNVGGKRIRSAGKDRYQDTGINAEFIDKDIEHGTLVAYLIRTPYKSLDEAIDDAQARIAIRPHFDAESARCVMSLDRSME